MNRIFRLKRFLLLSTVSIGMVVGSSEAYCLSTKVKALLKLQFKTERNLKTLQRKYDLLSSEEKANLIAATDPKRITDADQDGLADVFEIGGDACDADTDDDGIMDGNEPFIDINNPFEGVDGQNPIFGEGSGSTIVDVELSGTIVELSGVGLSLLTENTQVVVPFEFTANVKVGSCGLPRREVCDIGRLRVGRMVQVKATAKNDAVARAYLIFGLDFPEHR
jgi:hypothetical protein